MNDFFCAHNLNFNLRGIERIAVEESECDAQQALSLAPLGRSPGYGEALGISKIYLN